jgi:hypothetical protein
LNVEQIPHLLGDGVLDREVRSGKRFDVPLLEVKSGCLPQIEDHNEEHNSTDTSHTGDNKALLALLVEDTGTLLALILHVYLGRVRGANCGTILSTKVNIVGHSEDTIFFILTERVEFCLKSEVVEVACSAIISTWRDISV